MPPEPLCALCHAPIPAGVHPYTLRLELFPAIEPSLEISAESMSQDFETELQRLIGLMEQMDAGQVHDQEERIFFSRSVTLCPACRDRLAGQLQRLRPPAS